jgi:hypothetical protein
MNNMLRPFGSIADGTRYPSPTSPVVVTFGPFEEVLADRYRFDAELGRGAMGTVYRATDLRLGRPVAIKVLNPLITNDLTIARFTSEIAIAAGLAHPNIIGIHDSGEANGHLYYVMDYLGGETLRAKLEREKQLAIEDALKITKDVADGLQYAHDRGVVHRDIKPENILLADGRACILDFGLAIAVSRIEADRLTTRGLSVGTPSYMSPEQAAGERSVGAAADQYSLACVLYEMLVGEPPFTGPTATSIAMRHMTERPVPPQVRRLSTPNSVNATIVRALEKIPADRFPSARAFSEATSDSGHSNEARTGIRDLGTSRSHRPRWVAIGVLAFSLGAATLRWGGAPGVLDWVYRGQFDTTRYAVVALGDTDSSRQALFVADGIRNALLRWNGISASRPTALRAVSLRGQVVPELQTAARAARAGRIVTIEAAREGEATIVRAELVDPAKEESHRTITTKLTVEESTDSIFAHIAYALLFDGTEAARDENAATGTQSRLAFSNYLRGRAASRTWNLVRADSALQAALIADSSFPQASLALAQVRSWMTDESTGVAGPLATAVAGAERLSVLERMHLSALNNSQAGRVYEACRAYSTLVERDSLDFAAWLGLADCNQRDNTVVPDATSRSGRRFRGSINASNVAYARAFKLVPTLNACCVQRADELRRRPLYTNATRVRFGHGAVPDTTLYGAYPELLDDTIAFVPVPVTELVQPPPMTHALAVEYQRSAFVAIALKRATSFPQSAEALEELSQAMDLKANPAALDTLRRARSLVVPRARGIRLAAMETWMRFKLAVPGRVDELKAARALADSLLNNSSPVSSDDASFLASMALLVGDTPRAAALSAKVSPEATQPSLPQGVRGSWLALLDYASGGGPRDSLVELEARLMREIASSVPPQQQAVARRMSLGRAIGLAFPSYQSPFLSQLDTSVALISAELAVSRNDPITARRDLNKLARARVGMRPGDLTLEALYPEAWLLAHIGDTASSIRRFVPTLESLSSTPSEAFFDPATAGSVIQSMQLRARIAAAQGDSLTARRWARAVVAVTDTLNAAARSTRSWAVALAR